MKKGIVLAKFPLSCPQTLYQAFSSGRHLSHIGRFTLTSFLINIGMPSEKVIELFRNISDFNERMTRYQVEHVAGERGSRTQYITPKCDTLKTHGVCTSPDELCQKNVILWDTTGKSFHTHVRKVFTLDACGLEQSKV
jgi:DNA primase large subunit